MSVQWVTLLGVGAAVPERVVTNDDLAAFLVTSDEWIVRRTGIRQPRMASPETATSDLAARAARQALQSAAVRAGDLDLILLAISTPDRWMPPTATLVQHALGANRAGALDVNAACAGFTYAVAIAGQFVLAGTCRTVLVIGADLMSRVVDWSDRSTAVLVRDAGGAVVLGASGRPLPFYNLLGADGSGARLIEIPAGGSRLPPSAETVRNRLHAIPMQGRQVFRFGAEILVRSLREATEAAGLQIEDLAHSPPGQHPDHPRGRPTLGATAGPVLGQRRSLRQHVSRIDPARAGGSRLGRARAARGSPGVRRVRGRADLGREPGHVARRVRRTGGGYVVRKLEVGLALGGGAARGLAHVGVLRELEEAGVAVTHVAGCSFGSIVGAAYVCGTLADLEARVRSLSRAELVRYADATFSRGVLSGDALLAELRHLTRGLHFEDVAVPFAVVATDLETGAPVVLRSGPIAEAVRASISIPGLFAPAQVGDRTLVDGGLAELVPVTALRELRPPLVIAVDVSNPDDIWTRAVTRARLTVGGVRRRWRHLSKTATSRLPGRAFTVLSTRRTAEQDGESWGLVRTVLTAFDITEERVRRAAPEPSADLVIRPDVRRFHGHQFDRAAEIIAEGRAAARRALPLIVGMAVASGLAVPSRGMPALRPVAGGGVAG